ncbi:MAG TPA: hypothetical protein VGD10_09445 [Allosphingosinicella sp.]|uniref:hypothetical protein n=1 Tax=Allosphingosinicella sp. TaxID=2823234 RepID=UPI002EDA0C56
MSGVSRKLQTLAPLLLVAGCASAPKAAPVVTATSSTTISVAGLQAVMGADARTLIQRFGNPDLDVREGTARKLQFSSAACVLDAYLYRRTANAEPVVTHVDARFPDGRDIDRASCVAALIARSQAR